MWQIAVRKLKMAKYSRHIKQDAIRQIILQDGPCESKMGEIRELVGLPPANDAAAATGTVNVNGNEVAAATAEPAAAADTPAVNTAAVAEAAPNDAEITMPQNAAETAGLRKDSYDRILDGLEGREINIGKNFLNVIEKIPEISWDSNSLELIINAKSIAHTNMNLLVNKIIHNSSPTIPFGLTTFVHSLLTYRVPVSYIRDADSRNIRQALLEIRGQPQTSVNAIQSEQQQEAQPEVPANNGVMRSEKRQREEEDDDITQEQFAKRQRLDVPEEGESRKRKRDVNDDDDDDGEQINKREKLENVERVEPVASRRSQRLKLRPDLVKDWRMLGRK